MAATLALVQTLPETVRVGPANWREASEIIALALEHGTPEGRRLARIELARMAEAADLHNATAEGSATG